MLLILHISCIANCIDINCSNNWYSFTLKTSHSAACNIHQSWSYWTFLECFLRSTSSAKYGFLYKSNLFAKIDALHALIQPLTSYCRNILVNQKKQRSAQSRRIHLLQQSRAASVLNNSQQTLISNEGRFKELTSSRSSESWEARYSRIIYCMYKHKVQRARCSTPRAHSFAPLWCLRRR